MNENSQDINQNKTIGNPAERIDKPQIPEVKSKIEDIISLSSDEDDAVEVI